MLEVYETIKNLRKKIINGAGPFLVEALTFRVRGHEEASGVKYVPENLIKKWKKKDPILQLEKKLIKDSIVTKDYINNIELDFSQKILPVIEKALKSPLPSSSEKDELKDVYKQNSFKFISSKNNNLKNKRFVDAISDCLYEKMKSDSKVLIMGQDIAGYGGVFKVTEGFVEEFGDDRIRNTPIIESGVIGTAMGLAIEGFKPIVEMQFADFVSVGFSQIVNNLAKTFYRWNQSINVTLRLPTGAGIGGGPFHSQSNESWFYHVPGLKLVYPSNPIDAKGLLLSSIDDENPVLFFEHKALYRSVKAEVEDGNYHIPIGKAKKVIEGSSLSVITYGMGVVWMQEFLKNNSEYDGLIEVIDLRSLLPWDKDMVFSSIKKTNKVIILNEDNVTGSISAEISAVISEYLFEYLDAPILRLGSIDTPIPFSSNIEKNIYLPINKINSAVKKLLEY